jgi:hypothetical protein
MTGDLQSDPYGNRLGIPTAQTPRPGIEKSAIATHHIQTLSELRALVNR